MKLYIQFIYIIGSVEMVRYDDSFRQLITTNIRQGVPTSEIVTQLHVAARTVQRYRQYIDAFGTVLPPKSSIGHRPKKIHLAAREALRDLLIANETMYQDEIQIWLLEEYDIEASQPTISRCLKDLNITRKKSERRNEDRDDALRAMWFAKLCYYKASQLVVVDESAASERTRDRRWGWSERGVPCRSVQSGQRSSRWSILPAIGINGYLEYEIYHGSFNSERFENFVKKLLRKMNPFPGPRSVLVMDNVATHHSPYVKEMCDKAGVRIAYLPPYSPDLSPIEESFSVLKAWMRRNRDLAQPLMGFYELFLHLAIAQCDFKRDARKLFRSCGIEVADDDTDIDYEELEV